MTLVADNGAKTSFDADGNIHWKDGVTERVFVFVNGQCKGSLINDGEGGNTFTGELSDFPADTYDFYFYYLGNNVDKNTIKSGDTSFSMDFSNQDGTLANLGNNHFGCGIMRDVEYDGSGSITAQALMQSYVSMGLFNTTGMAESGEKVYFYGDNINNKISVSFSDGVPTYTYEKTNSGYICAGTPSAKTYVILVPNHTNGSESKPTAFTFVSKRTTGSVDETTFPYGIIGGRFYCASGNTNNAISITTTAYDGNILRGDFSVASGTTVKFSADNLLADVKEANVDITSKNCTWKFADDQYYHVGIAHSNDALGNNQVTIVGTVDLFGWVGSSSSLAAYGINDNTTLTAYGNVAQEAIKADWGSLDIANGGSHSWRTLTMDEWLWMVGPSSPVPGTNCRTSSTVNSIENARFTYANITIGDNTHGGIIIFPNTYTAGTPAGVRWGTINGHTTKTICTSDGWNALEAAGCVFLVAAGDRTGNTVHPSAANGGYYWSSTSTTAGSAYILYFPGSSNPYSRDILRENGCNVRLVF